MSPTDTLAPEGELHVPHQKFTLDNGLQVIVHEDHGSAVAAVYVCYHVGSAREEPGRSGFAHLFEHMLFQGSQHVAEDGHFRLVNEAGGTLNGQTSFDRTLYFETLPANQLELALWLEADRMGFLLPAMTQAKLDNQREVVRNERRQNYEIRPYGEASGALHAALFPAGHPYHWIPIGSHADLEAATLGDIDRFFRRWYGPNNATLSIGGDVDTAEVLELVRRYFGPIPRSGPVNEAGEIAIPDVPRLPAQLAETQRIELVDQVQLPRIVFAWPAPAQGEDDESAMDLLAMVLSENRSSVIDRALMVDELLAREVYISNHAGEVAGRLSITVTAAPGVELDTIEARIHDLLDGVVRDGVDPDQLQRMKTRLESRFVRSLETVSGRTRALAESNSMTGDPLRFLDRIERLRAVTAQEVHDVLRRYLAGRPCVALTITPGEKPEPTASEAAAGSPSSSPGRSADPAPAAAIVDEFDRGVPPAAGPMPEFRPPAIWTAPLSAGSAVWGTPFEGVPLTRLLVAVPAGRTHESPATAGLSALTADWMHEGTQGLSSTELSDALDALGADLEVISGQDEIQVAVTTLDEHLSASLDLVRDVLLEPRFSEEDFARVREQRLNAIDARQDSINAIAEDVWRRLMFGADSVHGQPSSGRRDAIAASDPRTAAEFHAAALARGGSRICLVGATGPEDAERALAPIAAGLATVAPAARDEVPPVPPAAATTGCIHFVDRPGAAQSELRVGHMSVSSLDPDHDPLSVLNYVLGGTFTSRINLNLREDKGYTYGARSGFTGGLRPGPFTAGASVHTQFTAESVRELMAELRGIRDGVRPEELEFARRALTQALLRRFESSAERLQLANGVSRYGRPLDWPRLRMESLNTLTLADLDALAQRHVRPDEMSILVVGDAARVRADLEALDLGPVVLLETDGSPAT